MKKILVLTTSLILTACSVGTAGLAHAENSEPLDRYPDSFTKSVKFDNLDDYAVACDKNATSGEKFAFLQNGKIFEYANGNFSEVYNGEKGYTVTNLYYSPEKALCYGDGENVFVLETNQKTELSAEIERIFTIGKYTYDEKQTIWVTDHTNTEPVNTELNDFSNLKQFGNTAYAVKENTLYTLAGTAETEIKLEYEDFTDVTNISSAGTAEALKAFSSQAPAFVSIKTGAYKTRFDVNALSENVLSTQKDQTIKAGDGETALLLFTFGAENSISAVMDGTDRQCYILRTADTSPIQRQTVNAVNLDATVDFNGKIYSCPAILESAVLKDVTAGEHLSVVGEVLSANNPEINGDYYKVEFKNENGETLAGYVPFGYLTPFHFDEKDPIITPDPDFSQKDDVKTVVLVILVIVLVLSACGYIIYIVTKKKSK